MIDNANESSGIKTKKFFYKLCKSFYFLCSPNYWFEDFNLSPIINKILNANSMLSSVLIFVYILMEWGAMYTQKDLNEKQNSDLFLFCLSQPLLFFNTLLFANKRNDIRKIIFNHVVKFKKVYNDLEIEEQMIKKSRLHNTILASFCSSSLVFYTLDAIVQIWSNPDATFTTTITAWPDVKDQQPLADFARTFFYFCWWLFVARISAMYLIVISTTICLNHQFRNLCSYFENLDGIFKTSDSQEVKEKNYEKGIKIGIKLHGETLQCTRLQQHVSDSVIGGQICVTVTVLVLLLSQMVNSERSAANTLTILVMGLCVLVAGNGCLMWNAGDVTVEASRLPTAIYLSGWHHCRGEASLRVRKLLTTAMTISQKPVILKSFGIIQISYDSYVTIAKSSYSIFSVLY